MATDKNFVIKNGLTVGTSEIITSAGNLTNIGTINSGTITSSGSLVLGSDDVAVNSDANITIREGNAFAGIDLKSLRTSGNISGIRSYNSSNALIHNLLFEVGGRANLNNSGGIALNNTTFIDASRNLTNIGTISSGANNGIIKEIGGDISLVQGAVGLRINDSASAISATTATSNNDASVDLGVSNIRFRNLYLSGTISSGAINVTGNNNISIGTYNTTDSGKLVLYGSTANKQADFYCSNGNLHIDADNGAGIYLNWYGSQSATSTAGTFFGNANGGQAARIDGSGQYYVGSTVVIDASRNLSNIGTISSGAITSSGDIKAAGDLWVNYNSSGNEYLNLNYSSGGDGGILFRHSNTLKWQHGATTNTGNNLFWYSYPASQTVMSLSTSGLLSTDLGYQVNGTTRINSVGDIIGTSYYVGGTNIIDTSRNLTNIGTISSGAITAPSLNSTGTVTINSTGSGVTLTVNRVSGQPNIKGGTDDGGYLIMDSSGGYLGLNWYSSDNIVIGLGGGNTGIGIIPSGYKLHVNGTIGSGAITSTSTVTATGGNSTNWNTAYGWGNHASQSYATESYVGTQISNLVDSSPAALNTLNELAAALGDNENFATDVNASIAAKLPLAGGTMTGNLVLDSGTSTLLNVKCDNGGNAIVRAGGDGQGTGAFEVSQDNGDHGGGMSYNGDGSPAYVSGETADHVTFYRIAAGTRTEVFHYPYSSNTVNFNGSITLGGTVDGVDIAARDAVLTSTTTTANAALPKAGGTMTGNLTIDYTGNATNDAGLYVANDNSDWGIYVNKDGTGTYGIKIAADGEYPFQITNSSGAEKFRVNNSGNVILAGTVDGVDIAARNAVLTSTTTTANAALPKAGGTMSGHLYLDNFNIYNINTLTFNDPGPNEGIAWTGGNTKIYESPDDLTTNSAGNLQVVYGSTRRLTVNSTGIDVNNTITTTYVDAETLKANDSGTTPGSCKLHVGSLLSGGSSAVAQLGGFVRMSDQLIIHSGTSADTVFVKYSGGNIDLTEGEGGGANPATIVNDLTSTARGSGWTDHVNLVSSDGTNKWNVLVDNGAGDSLRFGYNSTKKVDISTGGNVDTTGFFEADQGFRQTVSGNDGLRVFGGNANQPLIRVNANTVGANSADYGFTLAYRGDRSGIENSLAIYSDNQTGTQVEAINIKQDGTTHFGADVYLNSKKMFFNTTNYGVGAGGHNFNSVYVDTLESGSSTDALELVYYQGPGVNIGSGAAKPLGCGALGVGVAQNGIRSGYMAHFKSTGDVALLLEADSDNVTETDNPFIRFEQDASAVAARIGYISGSNDFEIFNEYGSDIYFGTNNGNRGKLDTSGGFTVTGNVTAYGSVSDIRRKENVEIIPNAIDKVKTLDGITFNFKDKPEEPMTGVIAQQVMKVLPEAVYEHETIEGEETLAVHYGNMVGLLIEGMKEQQKQIDELKEEVSSLSSKI